MKERETLLLKDLAFGRLFHFCSSKKSNHHSYKTETDMFLRLPCVFRCFLVVWELIDVIWVFPLWVSSSSPLAGGFFFGGYWMSS